MKAVNFIFILLTAISIISCEEKTFNDLTGEGTLLKEVVVEGEIIYKYTYNDANLVKEEKNKFHYTEHKYNNKNQLIQSDYYWDERIASSNLSTLQEALDRNDWVTPENTERDLYTTFEYDSNGQLKRSTIHRLNSNDSEYSTYVYADGKIEKQISYYNNQQTSLKNYYYDQYDNLLKVEKFIFTDDVQPVLSSSNEYYFDKKNNAYLSFNLLIIPGVHTNKNNVIKEDYTIYSMTDGSVENVQTNEYTYTYNAKDFPEQRSDGTKYTYY
jgi:hypothetical protein